MMWSEEGRELSGEEVRKPVKRRKVEKAPSPLSRVQHPTNLSLQYDNDGNAIHHEPSGYAKDSGH